MAFMTLSIFCSDIFTRILFWGVFFPFDKFRIIDCPPPTLGKETATHYSFLALEIPWTEEPGGLQSTGSQRVGHD